MSLLSSQFLLQSSFRSLPKPAEKARQTTCLSNQKQIGLAFASYSQDYDEAWPYVFDSGAGSTKCFDTSLQPYLGIQVSNNVNSAAIFICPSDTYASSIATFSRRTYAIPRNNNPANPAVGLRLNASQTQMCNIADVKSPADTILVVEHPQENNAFGRYNGANCDYPGAKTATDSVGQVCGASATNCPKTPLHSGGWNYLFCDYHAKWLRPEATINGNGYTAGTLTAPGGMWTIADND